MASVKMSISLTEDEKRKLDELLNLKQPRSVSAFFGHLINEAYSRSLHTLVDVGGEYKTGETQ